MLAPPTPVNSIQAEVLHNIRSERIGGHTVADLHAPDSFLQRVADRVIRESFQERFRVIVADGPGVERPPALSAATGPRASGIRVVERPAGEFGSLREGRPEVRGFMPSGGNGAVPMDLHPELLSAEARAAAGIVAARLASDGLLLTCARAIEALGPGRFERPGHDELQLLARIGVPVDMLAGFTLNEGTGVAAETVRAVAAAVRQRGSAERCGRELARAPFALAQTCAGFRALADSGQEPICATRVQVTSDSYWSGPGDGGCVDLLAQLVRAIPGAAIVASIERKHAPGFVALASAWGSAEMTVIPQDLPVSQWAQDNGKAGRDGAGTPVVLLPRYASRGEVGAVLVPGETAVGAGLEAAGVRTTRSPLHFQGGNLIMAVDDRSGERMLIAGEAEVWRNTGLGLTAAQVESALCTEFGVDRIVVLPAASFHTDFEVSIRSTDSGLVALVNDAPAAARIILACGVGALVAAGAMGAAPAQEAVGHLRAGRTREALSMIGLVLAGAAIGPGRYSESFAGHFRVGEMDHGPSNLHRVLLAADVLAALSLIPSDLSEDPATRAYLETFVRQEADRRILRRRLEDAGMRVVTVPSLAELHRGVNALNGLHEPGRYLMPAYGGLLAPVDDAARSAIQLALGRGVAIEPILCAETQRRSGAVRCAVSVLARG